MVIAVTCEGSNFFHGLFFLVFLWIVFPSFVCLSSDFELAPSTVQPTLNCEATRVHVYA
jgi:hypothetical protein